MDKLKNFIKQIQSEERFKDFDEVGIKQAIVLKTLSLMEWDPFDPDEIHPEYRVEEDKVDFALKHKDSLKAFIVVKKDLIDFKEHIEIFLGFSAQCNVKIAIYTNGFFWWFFLPLIEGTIDDKMFCTIDIQKEKIEVINEELCNFLSKENIISNKAVISAEDICNRRKEVMLINEYLPKAWEKIMNEPDKWLADIMIEVTEGLCGFKPDIEKVKEFMKSEVKIRAERSVVSESSDLQKTHDKNKKNYKGMSVKSLKFKEKEYDIKSWDEIPWKICHILSEKHKDSFNSVLWINLNGRNFFSKNGYEFLVSREIPKTNIYLNTDLSEKIAFALTNEILLHFGYDKSDIDIKAE